MNVRKEQIFPFDDYLAATLALSGLALPTVIVAETTNFIIRNNIQGHEGLAPLSLLSVIVGVKAVSHARILPLREN